MIPLSDTRTSGRFPIQTILLIGITVAVFLWQLQGDNFLIALDQYALTPVRITPGDSNSYTTFLTAIFLHGGLLHLASNMLFLWVFGDNIEDAFGWRFLPFYLTGGVIANVGQYLLDPSSTIPVLGASGAVAAVLGAYFIRFPHHQVRTLVPIFFFLTVISIPASVLLLFWFVLQLFNGVSAIGGETFQSGGVAYAAHVVGFLFGVGVAFLSRGSEHE